MSVGAHLEAFASDLYVAAWLAAWIWDGQPLQIWLERQALEIEAARAMPMMQECDWCHRMKAAAVEFNRKYEMNLCSSCVSHLEAPRCANCGKVGYTIGDPPFCPKCYGDPVP